MEMGRSQRKETILLLRVADLEGIGYTTSMCEVPKREYDTGLQNFKWMDKTVRDSFTFSSPLGARGHPVKTVGRDSR